jgi:hypothetical protein
VVDGEALGFVAGDRVAVGDVPGVEVAGREQHGDAVITGGVDDPTVRVD